MTTREGYAKVRVGCGHPLADPNGYAYEHLVIWCSAGNLRPDDRHLLHHRNGDRSDNRIENLELMVRGSHNAVHNTEKRRNAGGRFMAKTAGRLLDGVEHNAYPDKVMP